MANSNEIPDDILTLMAARFRMLSDPTRLAILRLLVSAEEKSVGQVVEETGHSLANVSKHLKLLAEAGMVVRRKEGLHVYYRLNDPVIEKICELVCDSIYVQIKEQTSRQR